MLQLSFLKKMIFRKLYIQIIIAAILLGAVIFFASKIKLMNEVSGLRKENNVMQSKEKLRSEIIVAEVTIGNCCRVNIYVTNAAAETNVWIQTISHLIRVVGIGNIIC